MIRKKILISRKINTQFKSLSTLSKTRTHKGTKAKRNKILSYRNYGTIIYIHLLGVASDGVIRKMKGVEITGRGCSGQPSTHPSSMHKAANALIQEGYNPVGFSRTCHSYSYEYGGGVSTAPFKWDFIISAGIGYMEAIRVGKRNGYLTVIHIPIEVVS